MNSFKKQFSLDKRSDEAKRIKKKYPARVPVIVEKDPSTDIADIDKKKYLVPSYLTIGQFVYVIRKRIKLEPEQAIYLFVNNTIPQTSMLISQVYKEHADIDGFLYFLVSGESTFGTMLF